MSIIDENDTYVTLAYDGTNAVPLKVDPITDRLLVNITNDGGSASNPPSKFDENSSSSALVVDDNGVIKPLIVDSNNNLLIDLVIE